MQTLMIRPCHENDLKAICGIEAASYDHPWSGAQLLGEFRNGFGLVYEDAGRVGGYLFYRAAADEMEITNLAIAPECRRRGLGRALLAQGIAEGRSRGAVRVFLDVRTGNLAALSLYESMGFLRTGKRKGYYNGGEDGVLMARETDHPGTC